MADLTLTPQLFVIFAAMVEDTCGIHYGPQDRELFGSKLAAQASDAGYQNLLDYYYRLRYDDPDGVEMRALVQSLVVHETYFFRELPPLVQLVDGHLTEIVKRGGRARIWSAACSTGEEPLTLAMLLAERGLLDKVEVVATDISEAAILRARAGKHSRRSVREGFPSELARKYLEITDAAVHSPARLRDMVSYRVVNLLDDDAVRALGSFDAIVCRNVMIYFRDSAIAQLIERLSRSLRPDGLICVGVSESLLRFGTTLACIERGGSFFYRSLA